GLSSGHQIHPLSCQLPAPSSQQPAPSCQLPAISSQFRGSAGRNRIKSATREANGAPLVLWCRQREIAMLSRRKFLGVVAASVALPSASLRGQQSNEWGSPVFDLHFHMRPQPPANLAHLDGAGIARANLLTRATAAEQVAAVQLAAPGRFTWFASADVAQPDSVQALTQAVKNGARGFGEMKFHS